ncbi:WD repeat-containing 89 [Brachionus plicatilis]|uniref:WD repeat-containing protein 89 n=1 Tax=Brachionus plicatilis TaxID=10195 RepID=A0A3M7SV97_BRAPC|nr:WD repeat-containing 89 [Brachionus plicatilis]
MNLSLECQEWTNTNKDARLIKTAKKSKQNKNQDLSNTIYLLQIAPSRSSNSKLACLMSNQFVNIFDQSSLKSILKFKTLEESSKIATEIGFYSKNDDLVFGSSDNGSLKCWDLRQNQSTEKLHECLCFKTDEEREFLSADINLSDNFFIVGTNKNVDNAVVYIFDVRMSGRFVHKLSESHSNDITQVKFDPSNESKFCTGSLDGLVCLYDLEQQSENIVKIPVDKNDEEDETDSDEDPDLMEQVFNAGSSIQKIGYLSSKCSGTDQLYAITYTNDLFVWDLQSHDVVHQFKSSNIGTVGVSSDGEQDEDYFFDCFYMKPDLMTICKGYKNGKFKLLNCSDYMDEICFETGGEDSSKRMHRDIIRSSYWNGQNFYTAGEDGFLFKWKLTDKNSKPMDSDDIEKTISNKRDLKDGSESENEEKDAPSKRPNKERIRKRNFFVKKRTK